MLNYVCEPYKEIEEVVQTFEEQLELFFSKDFETKTNKPKQDENLGQVFTSAILAKFMIGLLKESLKPYSSILDPCIGPNTFFKAMNEDFSNCNLKGIEIDISLITEEIKKFYESPNRTLIKGSFFDLPITEKFDQIVQNPPYVRQELLIEGANSKDSIRYNVSSLLSTIPSQSNLYIYFLLKSILHLKEGGVMVAVIYDSWLYSSFGKFLKESFLKLGRLENIYHFKKSAFDNVEVGATVIKFVKDNNHKKSISYYPLNDLNDLRTYNGLNANCLKLKQQELLTYSFNNQSQINYKSSLFKELKTIVSQPIQRGTSAVVNSHFIFSKNELPELKPIIKDVSRIKTYTVNEENAYILAVNGSISNETKQYLESVKNEILKTPTQKFIAVKRDIETKRDWYKINLKATGNFIFNYYLRNNIDFIYNPNKFLSSDNFYILNIKNNELANFAILNSSFTRLNTLSNSRSQGNGLRKIQLYEFKEVKVIDVNKLSELTIKKLELLGKELMNVSRYEDDQKHIIESIDLLLIEEYNAINCSSLTIDVLINEIKEYLN
ncbi:Eco57I restriction-modification methylase domain-containing protein [Chryseobacterium taklimakanense]|uniref:Eco57I restriction-modification methylase domain-containing protein n=1 Tax=Chryseobacterium taklimakanense TaxID=536441 RepID=UPI001EF6A380|nr:Eco57I restriction-modification methylase domain-containing protein [Chryseobacterium taklimakanense]MCG7279837.1 Eco57I restriction-modification methylase domain-containing protein [Chryseobacterium taklimakanense]